MEKFKNLPHPDHHHLEAAEGWFELGNLQEANEELERITPQLKAHPLILELRYKIYTEAGRQDMAVEVDKGMSELMPDNPWGHFHMAFSLHELKRTQEAYDTLIPVVDKFPTEWLMLYNLACYSCQLAEVQPFGLVLFTGRFVEGLGCGRGYKGRHSVLQSNRFGHKPYFTGLC